MSRYLKAAIAVVIAIGITGCASTPKSGEIGVVRNGKAWYMPTDWFDNHNIRGHVANGSGQTFVGLGSEVHYYPVSSQQRFFRLQTCGGEPCAGADSTAITVPTADGVEVTISGTFYLNTAFEDSAKGLALVKKFDTQFSTRTFEGKHPFEGNEGWSKFLAAIVEPVIQNNMRQVVAGVTCAELVSSCALVQNQGNVDFTKTKQLASGKVNQNNVQQIQDAINANLETDLASTLSTNKDKPDHYFQNLKFNLSKVELPRTVQEAIDSAQANFAGVSKSQADVQKAILDARANEEKQKGYDKCPSCSAQDYAKAWGKTKITTLVIGDSNTAIPVGGK